MIRNTIKENSSVLLSVGAGFGVVATAYLAARAGYQTAHALESSSPYELKREKAKRVWKLYIPPAGAAAATVVCVVGIKRVDFKKTLAAQTALAVTQQAYSEYRSAVVEELGEKRDQLLLSKVAEKVVREDPPKAEVILSEGKILCQEAFTCRYFESSMNALGQAVNQVNARLLSQDYATLDDFYYLIGISYTQTSGQTGWKTPRLMELEYSAILTPDGRPCMVINYNYVVSM